MKYIGAHVSIEGGISNAPLRAEKIGAKAFACFTKNQRRWHSAPYMPEEMLKFKDNLKKSGILGAHVMAHSSYLINLGHPDQQRRETSIDALIDEVNRCEQLGIKLLNFHPGSHLREITEEESLNNAAESINVVLAATNKVILVIENTAGQGSNLGYKFEHLAHLISKVKNTKRIGVCIDTCHLFVAGYDFRNKKEYNKTWDKFNEIVGFGFLKGLHLNDSQRALGSGIDRHEMIGKGKLGYESFKLLMQDHRFDSMPLILETTDPSIWHEEIKLLYSFSGAGP
jgi:deoxyribonuclease IV